MMAAWLAKFHVRYRPEVAATLGSLAGTGGARLEIVEVARRYALLMRFTTATIPAD